jgi:hypothetical protein
MRITDKTRPLILAPLAGPVVLFAGLMLFSIATGPRINGMDNIGALLFGWASVFLLAYPVCLIATWVIGTPLIHLLRRLHLLSLGSVSIAGTVLGSAVFLLVMVVIPHGSPYESTLLALYGAIGAAMGFGVAHAYGRLAGLTRRRS